jgi:hypothetical protein
LYQSYRTPTVPAKTRKKILGAITHEAKRASR